MTQNSEDPRQRDPEIEVEPETAKSEEGGKSKIAETVETLKKNKTVHSTLQYAQHNVQDTIAYAFVLLGAIIWAFFHAFYGQVLIGLVTAFYFSQEILQPIKGYHAFIEVQGTARSIIFGATALAFLLAAPGIFVGAAIMVALKVMLRAD